MSEPTLPGSPILNTQIQVYKSSDGKLRAGSLGKQGGDVIGFESISKDLQSVVYADDFKDSFTGIDIETGRNLGSSVYQGLEKLKSEGGGTLILSNKAYYPVGGDIFNPLTYDNITIKGAKMPYFNSDATGLLEGSGTIIQGSLCFITPGGQALRVSDLGVDVGKNICDTYYEGVATDGLCWAMPTDHNPLSPYTENALAENITVIAYGPRSLCHAFLFEGVNGGVANNILTMYGFHGIVNKSRNTFLTNLRAYFHGGEGVIIKSDDYAISESVYVNNVFIDNLTPPQGVVPWLEESYDYGMLMHASTGPLGYINIGDVFVRSADNGFSFKIENNNSLSAVNVKSITTDMCLNSLVYLGDQGLRRTYIDLLTGLNSTGYIVIASNGMLLDYENFINTVRTASADGAPKPSGVKLENSTVLSFNEARWFLVDYGYNILDTSELYINKELNGWVLKKVSGTSDPNLNVLANDISGSSKKWDGQEYTTTPTTLPYYLMAAPSGGGAWSYSGLPDVIKSVGLSVIEYTDNAAAIAAGLTVGAFYRTGDILKVVH